MSIVSSVLPSLTTTIERFGYDSRRKARTLWTILRRSLNAGAMIVTGGVLCSESTIGSNSGSLSALRREISKIDKNSKSA